MNQLTRWTWLFVFFYISCGSSGRPKVVDKEKMQDILTDLLLAEGFTENFLLLDTSKKRDEWLSEEYSKVMAIHQVSQDAFRESLDYYKRNPDLFKIIIDSVNQRGIRNRDEFFQADKKKKTKLKLE